MNNEFDYNKFKEEFNSGDLNGLEYLEKTTIEKYKQHVKDHYNDLHFTREEYIINLFYAVKELNTCNHIYEVDGSFAKADNFDYDLYFNTRDLLFKELGFDIDKLCE